MRKEVNQLELNSLQTKRTSTSSKGTTTYVIVLDRNISTRYEQYWKEQVNSNQSKHQLLFKTGTCYKDKDNLELAVNLLPLPPKYLNQRHAPILAEINLRYLVKNITHKKINK